MPQGYRVTSVSSKYSRAEIEIYRTEVPDRTAEFAMALIEKWGMVAAVEDGEDSAGRQKFRLATVTEVVDRAVEAANLAMTMLRDLGWITKIPTPDEAELALGQAPRPNKER